MPILRRKFLFLAINGIKTFPMLFKSVCIAMRYYGINLSFESNNNCKKYPNLDIDSSIRNSRKASYL